RGVLDRRARPGPRHRSRGDAPRSPHCDRATSRRQRRVAHRRRLHRGRARSTRHAAAARAGRPRPGARDSRPRSAAPRPRARPRAAERVSTTDPTMVARVGPPGTGLLGMAHYGAVAGSPGAADNAPSVALLLELARTLRDEPPPEPVVLAFTANEEIGLVGAE